MPDEVINTEGTEVKSQADTPKAPAAQPPTIPDMTPAQALAMQVLEACGKTEKGDMTALPILIPQVLEASDELLRAALKETMLPAWLKKMPKIDEYLNALNTDQLRYSLVLSACYWNLGRIQAVIESQQEG